MYCCRHCSKEDYYRLEKLINGFTSSKKKSLDEAINYCKSIIVDIEAFDDDISRRLSFTLSSESLTKEEKVTKLESYLFELKQNVLIDVYEHSEK